MLIQPIGDNGGTIAGTYVQSTFVVGWENHTTTPCAFLQVSTLVYPQST